MIPIGTKVRIHDLIESQDTKDVPEFNETWGTVVSGPHAGNENRYTVKLPDEIDDSIVIDIKRENITDIETYFKDLPDTWKGHRENDGSITYVNQVTKQKLWDRPTKRRRLADRLLRS